MPSVMAAAGVSPFLPNSTLERQIGKPREDWAVDDLLELFRERGLRHVSLMHVGGDGWLKTLDFVPHSVAHLRDIVEGGERADGSQLFAGSGLTTGASDIALRPRVSSAFLDPFAELPTLVLLCGHLDRSGRPLAQSPDTIVRRAQARLRQEAGVELWALGEVEYFLGRRSGEHDVYGHSDRGYHASSPFVFGEKLRRRALAMLADLGVPAKYGHSEVGYIEASQANGMIWEQHEIELSLLPLPEAADAVLLTQWLLRNLAHEHGMQCSTEPMMQKGHAGNGLHFHFSPVVDGEPQPVRTQAGALGEHARHLIAGLVRLGGALMAFGNRAESSFARLVQGKEAPKHITWGDQDRSALVRIPIVTSTAQGRVVTTPTVEFRLPDGSALPHLLLAGIAQAMLAARQVPDIDHLLEGSASSRRTQDGEPRARVPWNTVEVAEALASQRAALVAGGVFPELLLDRIHEQLRG